LFWASICWRIFTCSDFIAIAKGPVRFGKVEMSKGDGLGDGLGDGEGLGDGDGGVYVQD